MSFWKTLGKIGAGVAAPFTGGASLAAIPAIDAVSRGLGSAADSMAKNRGTSAELALDQNEALERQLLAREQEKRGARNDAYQNALRGSVGMGWQPPTNPANLPVVNFGGSRGGALAGKAMGDLYLQSMNRLGAPDLNGPQGMPAYRNMAQDPAFQKSLKPGFWEKLMGVGSAVAPIAGLLMNRDQPTNK